MNGVGSPGGLCVGKARRVVTAKSDSTYSFVISENLRNISKIVTNGKVNTFDAINRFKFEPKAIEIEIEMVSSRSLEQKLRKRMLLRH